MDKDGLPAGAIASIVIGTLIIAFWIVLIVNCCIKRKNVYNQTTVSEQGM